jgi:TM2 domain-containing membrane protein YozV
MSEQNIKSHPGVAAVLSFIFNGIGQIYNGQILKGLLIIFFSTIGMILVLVGAALLGYWILAKAAYINFLIIGALLFGIGLIFICILGIYSIIDAYQVAKKS